MGNSKWIGIKGNAPLPDRVQVAMFDCCNRVNGCHVTLLSVEHGNWAVKHRLSIPRASPEHRPSIPEASRWALESIATKQTNPPERALEMKMAVTGSAMCHLSLGALLRALLGALLGALLRLFPPVAGPSSSCLIQSCFPLGRISVSSLFQ